MLSQVLEEEDIMRQFCMLYKNLFNPYQIYFIHMVNKKEKWFFI